MRARSGVVAAAVFVACGAAQAVAAAKPACLLVVDPAGDGLAYGVSQSPSLDILSADIATGRKNLVAAVRLAGLQPGALQAGGTSYTFVWTVNGVTQSVAYHVYGTGGAAGRFDADAKPGAGGLQDEVAVPVVADPTTKTITWTVPRKLVAALKKPGARFSGLGATAKPSVNQRLAGEGRSQVLSGGDVAQSVRTYTDLAPTCLKGA